MLTIANVTDSTIWVSIMWYTPNCRDGDDNLGDWTKSGWWRIDPGKSANVFGGDLHEVNRYFCYYATNQKGLQWSGPYHREVPYVVYQWCENMYNSESFSVGFRLLDIGDFDDFTLYLISLDFSLHPI